MKVKTANLSGVQLDYAVACSINMGQPILHITSETLFVEMAMKVFSPSAKWNQCGELMEKYSISCYQSADPATGKVYHWVGVNELVARDVAAGSLQTIPVWLCVALSSSQSLAMKLSCLMNWKVQHERRNHRSGQRAGRAPA